MNAVTANFSDSLLLLPVLPSAPPSFVRRIADVFGPGKPWATPCEGLSCANVDLSPDVSGGSASSIRACPAYPGLFTSRSGIRKNSLLGNELRRNSCEFRYTRVL